MKGPIFLRLFYDYVDPASYLLEQRLRVLEGSAGISLVLEPFEILPPPSPLMDPEEEGWGHRWDAMMDASDELGIALKRPWIVPWSRKAHELALYAEAGGCFRETHDTLYRAYLSEGMDIGRVDVLVNLARRIGMDPRETKAALDVDLHRESVLRKRNDALDLGVRSTPTLLWRGRKLDGYPDDQTLREFLALDERQET